MTNNRYHLDWLPKLATGETPAYLAIVDALVADIKNGALKAGQRLPPQRLLAYTLNLNTGTVHKAYRLAMKKGLIAGEVGRGSFVRGDMSQNESWPNADPFGRAIDFCDNYPCRIKNTDHVRQQLAALQQAPHLDQLLQYQQNSIWPGHQATAQRWLTQFGIASHAQNTITTNGALHAGFISLLTLCRPGDLVLTEELTSQAIRETASRLKLRLKGIKMDRHGIVPDHLDELLRREKVAVVYLVPTLHNPTGTVLSMTRRQKVATILNKHQVCLIEDDIFAGLLDDPPSSICSLVPELGFYISGLSKTVAPALRLGFLKMPDRYYQDCLANLRITTWLASPLLIELTSGLMTQGAVPKMIREQKVEIKKRQALARDILGSAAIAGSDQALHIWLTLPEPWRAAQFKEALKEREVLVQAVDAFAVERSYNQHAVRICLGTPPTLSKVKEGLQIIRQVLNRGSH